MINKYLTIAKLSWQNGLVYRTSLVMWRIRQFLSTLMALTIWQVLFDTQDQIFQYQQDQMIGYIFLISILQSTILTTIMHGLASDIYSGKISNILLKPLNIFYYLASLDIADKLKNIAFVIVETIILALIFKPTIILPSPIILLLFLLTVLIGIVIYFLVLLLLGSIGFWSPETWAPRFLFATFLQLTAGKLFPLDILPQTMQNILFFTPFPYLSYFQTQIFLGKLTTQQTISSVTMSVAWLIILTVVVKYVWKKGIKNYSAVGM